MARRFIPFIFIALFLALLSGFYIWAAAQEPEQSNNVIRVVVGLVQLNVAVTDAKGNYVTNLKPSDFLVSEDGIPQTVATFEEGNETPRTLGSGAAPEPSQPGGRLPDGAFDAGRTADSPEGFNAAVNGASVFILFDTSNYMYRARGFVYAQDAIAEFIRSLDHPYRLAFYSYSRDFFRAAPLTSDRMEVLRGVRATVNGDDAALYNALLMTLQDAGHYSGRKVVVVFSNGPDNASMVAPEDVDEMAQSEGIPIYMISTQEAKLDPASTAVFGRMSAATGGEAYFAKSWRDQRRAFDLIREDLAHLYFLSYYPQPNPNRGWRKITVKLAGQRIKNLRIRTRNGYRPIPVRATADPPSAP